MNGLPTPTTSSHKLDYLSVTPFAPTTPLTTPTPSRFHDALSTTATTPSHTSTTDNLTSDLQTFLTTLPIPITPTQRTALNSILAKNTHRTAGLLKGREVLREAVRSREETIARLRRTVVARESEVEGQKGIVLHLRQLLEDNRKAAGGG